MSLTKGVHFGLPSSTRAPDRTGCDPTSQLGTIIGGDGDDGGGGGDGGDGGGGVCLPQCREPFTSGMVNVEVKVGGLAATVLLPNPTDPQCMMVPFGQPDRYA